jgi:hypothetical protein
LVTQRAFPAALDKPAHCPGSGANRGNQNRENPMEMLNPHCGIDRDPRGVVRLSICNAGSLNILSSAVTDSTQNPRKPSSRGYATSAKPCEIFRRP